VASQDTQPLPADPVDGAASPRRRAGLQRVARLRLIARVRRRWAPVLLALPILLVFLVDARIRGDRLITLSPKYLASYGASMLESALLWGLLLLAASARRGPFRWIASALFVTFATIAVGVQIYFHRQYAVYLNLDATLFGTSFSTSVLGQLKADSSNFATSMLPPLLLSIGLVWIGRLLLRPSATWKIRAVRPLGPAAIVAALFFIPCSWRTVQASTPDVIYFHAIGGLVKELTGVHTTAQVRPGLRTPPKLPALTPAPTPKRNVIFILTESVRSDVSCSEHQDACPNAPEINRAVPSRHPLLQMRGNASTTAIELSVLWSGLEPVSSREALHTAPLLFDYARAAGIDNAYWTSHHMLFANSRLYVQDLPTSKQCGATDLDPAADIDLGGKDELLTARVKREIVTLKEPFFSVVHYGNTHVPYRVDPDDSPFQPSFVTKSPAENEAYRNYYKNAVYLQDKTIGDFIRFVRQSPFGDHTILVFTSDHGEAFREHGQIGHTGAILDEEIHVPFWIDAPPGTLTEAEEKAVVVMRSELAWHTDLTPTMLDLMGILDAPELASYRKTMVGSSLLRPPPPPPTLYLTNCSGIWGCAFRNWGMMRGARKLEAREWDDHWHCYDVLTDPKEEHDLGLAACGDMPALAEKAYGGLPSSHQ
jgi:glucan phosphoethanolaminetransferase (alkaline phosphatase superfamily)